MDTTLVNKEYLFKFQTISFSLIIGVVQEVVFGWELLNWANSDPDHGPDYSPVLKL